MITLIPAYGRDYQTQAAVLADWDAGKDFKIMDISNIYDGKYANKSDLKNQDTVKIRYNNLTEQVIIK